MLEDRLGLDVPKGWWPNPPMLKAMEAAGFGWVQARTPPRSVLRDSERLLVRYDPTLVRGLALRLGSQRAGMLFDAGHANIVAGQRGTDLCSLLEPVLPFHLHDNLGARGDLVSVPGLDPLRLDLHLAPGAGRLGWGSSLASCSVARCRSCWRCIRRTGPSRSRSRRSPPGCCSATAPPWAAPARRSSAAELFPFRSANAGMPRAASRGLAPRRRDRHRAGAR